MAGRVIAFSQVWVCFNILDYNFTNPFPFSLVPKHLLIFTSVSGPNVEKTKQVEVCLTSQRGLWVEVLFLCILVPFSKD